MQELTPEGQRIVEEVAGRHGVSQDAVLVLLRALVAGGGTMAQFSHPDLGGMGQWTSGGMIMVGDMFNNGLKFRVDELCRDLAGRIGSTRLWASAVSNPSQSQGRPAASSPGSNLFAASHWWPSDLGVPSTTGAQNDLAYAYFPTSRQLAIKHNNRVTVYDTGDHQIGGVSQQQSIDQSLTFTSQHGPIRLADLPLISHGSEAQPSPPAPDPSPTGPAAAPPAPASSARDNDLRSDVAPPSHSSLGSTQIQATPPATASDETILAAIERLHGLQQKGALTEEEFAAKKAELLGRL